MLVSPFVRVFAILTIGIIIEAALPPDWPHPDLVLLMLVPLAFRGGWAVGMLFGFFGGLALGMFGSGIPGIYAAVYAIIGFILGFWGDDLKRVNYYIYIIAMLIGIGFSHIMFSFAGHMWPSLGMPAPILLRSGLPGAIFWNLVLLWPAIGVFNLFAGSRAFKRMEIDL